MAKGIALEAIAAAKDLRKLAHANARLSLFETFQPTLQRMVSSKLREEEDELEGEDNLGDELEIDVNFPEDSGISGVDLNVNDQPFGGGEEGGDDIGMASFDDDEDGGELDGMTDDSDLDGEETDQELESLMREFDMEGDDAELEDDDLFSEAVEDGLDFDDSVDPTDDVVEALIRAFEAEDGEDWSLDESEDDGGAYTETPPTGQPNHESRQLRALRAENKKLKQELTETRKANVTYKRTINEINLLNAKLQFATKALRTQGLNENQQLRILEAFDRASSVREVKLVYTTILESLNKKPIATAKKRQVQEGLASKKTTAIKPTNQLNENVDTTVLRMKQLAGLATINY